jgi:hypothetical protein
VPNELLLLLVLKVRLCRDGGADPSWDHNHWMVTPVPGNKGDADFEILGREPRNEALQFVDMERRADVNRFVLDIRLERLVIEATTR